MGYGYLTAGSKISAIASGICAAVALSLTFVQSTITPWPAALFCLLLVGMFGKKAASKKEEESMCPVHGDAPAMTEDKKADPMAKYTRMEEGGKSKSDSPLAKPIMTVLTVFSIVQVALLVQLAF